MKFSVTNAFTALLAAPLLTSAVKYGDEEYGDVSGGRFWAFYENGVAVVDPDSCTIERTITQTKSGKSLPGEWADVIYMEKNADRTDRFNTGANKNGYVMINSRDAVTDDHGADGDAGEVFVFSANPADADDPIVSQVIVGARPIHSYGIYPRDEFWTHSDGDGQFYVIKLDDIDQHTGAPVKAYVNEGSHGKLLWDEDENLKKHGYATATGERHLFVMDMETNTLLSTYSYIDDLADNTTCRGTHAISYTGSNEHLYVECAGGGGILEFDVSEPTDPKFVHQHEDVTGALNETPDGSYMVVTNGGANTITVFEPAGTGVKSSIPHVVDVPGNPSPVGFYPTGNAKGEYTVCSPLTGNPNANHLYPNKTLACDRSNNCDGATTEEDVAAGVCMYEGDPQAARSGEKLREVAKADISKVIAKEAPYFEACNRCAIEANYENDKCTCTPTCGSCGEVVVDLSNLGVRCFDMGEVLDGTLTATNLIPNAGGVAVGGRFASSNECGFGWNYRVHKRGGKYDASIANLPTNSLQIVNMETQTLKCAVDLPGRPGRVTYAPPQAGTYKPATTGSPTGAPVAASTSDDGTVGNANEADNSSDDDDGLSGGAIAGIVIGAIAAVGAIAFLASKSGGDTKEPHSEEVTAEQSLA